MYDSRHRSSVRRKTYIVAPLVLLGSALASGTIFGASPATVNVRGKVTGWDKLVPQVYAEAAADPHRYTWREPSPTVKTEFRRLSANVSRDVCIVATSAAQSASARAARRAAHRRRLTPSTLVLSPGSRLSFSRTSIPSRTCSTRSETTSGPRTRPPAARTANGRRPPPACTSFAISSFPASPCTSRSMRARSSSRRPITTAPS